MKKAFGMIAVMGLVAAPLMAAPLVHLGPDRVSQEVLLGSPSNPGGSSGNRTPAGYANGTETLYDNMAGAFGVTGSSPFTVTAIVGSATFILDDIHLNSTVASASLGAMHWLFYNPSGLGTAPISSTTDTIAFFSNPGGANTAIGATIAAFGVTLGTGFILQTLNFGGSGLVLPKDSWVGFRKNQGFVIYTGGGSPAAFGTASSQVGLAFGAFPSPGITSSTVLPMSSIGSFSSPDTGNGSLHIAMDQFPEPASIALLTLGGLVALRRRRAA